MEPLSMTLDDPLFHYEQVCRQGMIAIYTQTHKPSGVQRFEVIRVQARQAHTWPNGQMTPEHEGYPGAKTWGREGFTLFTLEAAQAKMQQWVQTKGAIPCP